MKRYDYYTPIDLARSMLNIIPEIEVKSIIDICCGSWNLLQAGKEKYPNAVITGVDIDKRADNYKIDESNFIIMDGREFAEKEYKKGRTYDLILSNPPFGHITENERKYMAGNAIVEVCLSKLLNKRYECEMMQANMLLAHNNSVLLFILPYTFVAGASFQQARCQVASVYSVVAIVKLPFTTFEKDKINTFAIILQKKEHSNHTIVFNAVYNNVWKINKTREVSEIEIVNGNWWFTRKNNENNQVKIFRGNISSNKFKKRGQMVLHSAAKKSDRWFPSVRYYDISSAQNVVKARKGDVLINRIGRDAGYWSVNEIDHISISDCLLIISNVTNTMIKILEEKSEDGRLKIPIHGVTTAYITAEDVMLLLCDKGEEISD